MAVFCQRVILGSSPKTHFLFLLSPRHIFFAFLKLNVNFIQLFIIVFSLQIQLRRERTEERRKMFQIADRRNRGGSNELENTPFSKWKKILPVMPNKSDENDDVPPTMNQEKNIKKGKSLDIIPVTGPLS